MRNLFLSVVTGAVLALSACSPQGADAGKAGENAPAQAAAVTAEQVKTDLKASCIADGEAEATCTCMVDAFALVMEPADLSKLLEHSRAKDDQAAQQLLMSKVMGDSSKMTVFGEAMAKCG